MKDHRFGEQGNVPVRSSRIFKDGDYWYYTTREGVDIGPFDSQSEADHGVEDFVNYIVSAEPEFKETLCLYSSVA